MKAEGNPTLANGVDSPRYWLMKAEPETRIEKGQDIKFSIDDLAAKKEPEPWDGNISIPQPSLPTITNFRSGIRNYAARNNLRAMKKGDLAFFYHSSCKVPAIVGIMEIVQEHSPDRASRPVDSAFVKLTSCSYCPRPKEALLRSQGFRSEQSKMERCPC